MVDSMFKDRFKNVIEKKVIQSFYKIHVHLINAVQLTCLKKKNEVEMMSIQFVTDSDFQTTTKFVLLTE